jgi:hypothetical protein
MELRIFFYKRREKRNIRGRLKNLTKAGTGGLWVRW